MEGGPVRQKEESRRGDRGGEGAHFFYFFSEIGGIVYTDNGMMNDRGHLNLRYVLITSAIFIFQ